MCRFSHYHRPFPSDIGLVVVGIVIVGNWHEGNYSATSGYGPVAGLFFNQSYFVDAHVGIGSLN